MGRTLLNNEEQRKTDHGALQPPRKWSPRELWTPTMTLLIALLIAKLLLFAILWCSETSWDALLSFKPYAHTILLAFILSIPIGMFRRQWLQLAVHLATDIWCASILSQGGGCPARLPVAGWLLTSALPEMEAGGSGSLPWLCLLLPLTTLLSLGACMKAKGRTAVPVRGKMQYGGYLLAWTLVTGMLHAICR